jgi:hypothetical protein
VQLVPETDRLDHGFSEDPSRNEDVLSTYPGLLLARNLEVLDSPGELACARPELLKKARVSIAMTGERRHQLDQRSAQGNTHAR